MGKSLLPDCEYCYMSSARLVQKYIDGEWNIVVYIETELLDSSKDRLPGDLSANTMLVVSGTAQPQRHTLPEMLNHFTTISGAVYDYIVQVKLDYANYNY